MKNLNSFVCAAVAVVSFFGKVTLAAPQSVDENIVKANNSFGVEIFSRLRAQPDNIVYSPFSVTTILAMTASGARGETARQMVKALNISTGGFDSFHSGYMALLKKLGANQPLGCQVVAANSVWVQRGYPIDKSFKHTIQTEYSAHLGELDFRTLATYPPESINSWIANRTHDKIRNVMEPGMIHSDTTLVLVNALCFQGRWKSPFRLDFTKMSPFQKGKGVTVIVPMMNKARPFRYVETNQIQFLEVSFADGKPVPEELETDSSHFSILILLPKDADALDKLENSITPEWIATLQDSSRLKEVFVSLPKFKIGSTLNLRESLKDMGMIDAFSGSSADFSGIAKSKPLFVELVRHRASINVDEEGCDATASTAVTLTHSGYNPTSPVFNANRPFLFLIRHNPTGLILFLGRITDPAKS